MVKEIVSKAIGTGPKRSAPNDPAKLCDDLNRALIEFWIRSSLRSKTAVERQAELADEVRRAAGLLASLLSSDEYAIQTYITSNWPNPHPSYTGLSLKDIGKHLSADLSPSLNAVVDSLRRIEVKAKEARSVSNKWTRRGLRSDRSPFEWLAGIALPKLYELQFNEKACIARPSGGGRPGGHFVRFAKAALDAAKINTNGRPYSEESIAKAYGTRRRSRRKPR